MEKPKHPKRTARNNDSKPSWKRGLDLFFRYLDEDLPAQDLPELNRLIRANRRLRRETAEQMILEVLLHRMARQGPMPPPAPKQTRNKTRSRGH